MRAMNPIDWPTTIGELQTWGVTLQEIADECGFASRGAVHELRTGESKTCSYERGCKLVAMHARAKRKQQRKVQA